MPFFRPTQSKAQLCEYLNRRKSTSQNSGSANDFFVRTRCDAGKPLTKNKRFNTTQPEQCDIDFRIMTVFQPSTDYTFTADCYKTKYRTRASLNALNLPSQDDQHFDTIFARDSYLTEMAEEVPIQFLKLDIEPIEAYQPKLMTKSLLMSKTHSPSHSPQNQTKTKSFIKYQIKHPTPVKQTEFLIKIKQSFLKRHNLAPKIKSNNLIKIEDYLTDQKDSFKRKMESELIRVGEAKLIPEIKQRKGKIYLGGLHGVKKKRKQVENIDKLLVRSRESFSTPNKLISHMKLASEKKNKLENIKQLNQAKLETCLKKIKNLNLQREFAPAKVT